MWLVVLLLQIVESGHGLLQLLVVLEHFIVVDLLERQDLWRALSSASSRLHHLVLDCLELVLSFHLRLFLQTPQYGILNRLWQK